MIQKSSIVLDVPRKCGKDDGDVTSFHPDYKTNGPDRGNRHKILFRYVQGEYPVPSYDPGTMIYRGQIVLDPDNDPVLNWREIPLVLSSAYEGYDIEVIRRLNQNITYRDFRARMPRTIIKGSTRKDNWGTSTLSMRNSRFRLTACCLAWAEREGSDEFKSFLDKLLPAECLAMNSTESFRDLTPYEVKQMKAPNKGNFLSRAGPRGLDEATRQQRNQIEQDRSPKLRAQHDEIVGAGTFPALTNLVLRTRVQKRKRAESSLDSESEEENPRPAKRQERSVNIDQPLSGARSSANASGSVVGSRPAFKSASNATSGLGQVRSAAPKSLVQYQPPNVNEFRLGQDFDMLDEGSCGPAEETPLYAEQPATGGSPYYLTRRQWQALIKEQNNGQPDFRFVFPANESERNSIQAALRYTREHFWEQLGTDVEIQSTPGETYHRQYQEILATYRYLWSLHEDGRAPVLRFLQAWGGDFDNWTAPSIE